MSFWPMTFALPIRKYQNKSAQRRAFVRVLVLGVADALKEHVSKNVQSRILFKGVCNSFKYSLYTNIHAALPN